MYYIKDCQFQCYRVRLYMLLVCKAKQTSSKLCCENTYTTVNRLTCAITRTTLEYLLNAISQLLNAVKGYVTALVAH